MATVYVGADDADVGKLVLGATADAVDDGLVYEDYLFTDLHVRDDVLDVVQGGLQLDNLVLADVVGEDEATELFAKILDERFSAYLAQVVQLGVFDLWSQ